MSDWEEHPSGPELVKERHQLLELLAHMPIDHPRIRHLLPIVQMIIQQDAEAAAPPQRRRGRPLKQPPRNPWLEIDRLNLQ